jgi:hypothetical protein
MLILLFPAFVWGADVVNFRSDAPGTVPRGWSVFMTDKGGDPRWEVVVDRTAPSRSDRVVGQTSTDPTNGRFPLLIHDNSTRRDGDVSVAFKAISGRVDQGAGLVWRYRDPNNYYVARANALEDNVVLYKVEKGARIPLAPVGQPTNTYGLTHYVPNGVWNTLRVSFKASRFTVYVNGQRIFDLDDKTFPEAGKVGLWTKSDSVIYFDNFEFK